MLEAHLSLPEGTCRGTWGVQVFSGRRADLVQELRRQEITTPAE